jgi:hypothetical protein
VARTLWEITAKNAPPLPSGPPSRDETRDETRPAQHRCAASPCKRLVAPAATGRPARYCSHACRQRAYRDRRMATPTS